ncbi:MAG: hypothetical protein SOV54_04115 [Faecalibacterium prausnitzii]|nr:hypothetical protein [Faecalibacterium prausnitzii]MDY2681913.1 hypothetical protein [Faecalibacterium prausnitzii]
MTFLTQKDEPGDRKEYLTLKTTYGLIKETKTGAFAFLLWGIPIYRKSESAL